MIGYLSADVICSESVAREKLCNSFEEQMITDDRSKDENRVKLSLLFI